MTKRQTIASAKYNAKTYEEIKLRVKIGEKDRYKALAARLGVSVNQLFVQSVEQYISDHIDELGTLPETAEDSGEH